MNYFEIFSTLCSNVVAVTKKHMNITYMPGRNPYAQTQFYFFCTLRWAL